MELFQGARGKVLPARLEWLREPPVWAFGPEGLEIRPAGRTDFFRPVRGDPKDNACLLATRVRGDFTARTRATADLKGFGDAAALTVRADATHWAKICVERSPFGETSIVTVVTNGLSDDANNELLASAAAEIRVTRSGSVFAFHYRVGDDRWRFVRTFGLEMPDEVLVGVHAQAPFVEGCGVTFADLHLDAGAVKDFRSGE